MEATAPFFIRRVRLRHYRSIGACDVALGPLTLLVGPNGSGKSNFLDSLRFVSQALNENLDNALRERGGPGEVRRRSAGHPTHFGIEFVFEGPGFGGVYKFQIGATKGGDFAVSHESCAIDRTEFGSGGTKSRFAMARSPPHLSPRRSPDPATTASSSYPCPGWRSSVRSMTDSPA